MRQSYFAVCLTFSSTEHISWFVVEARVSQLTIRVSMIELRQIGIPDSCFFGKYDWNDATDTGPITKMKENYTQTQVISLRFNLKRQRLCLGTVRLDVCCRGCTWLGIEVPLDGVELVADGTFDSWEDCRCCKSHCVRRSFSITHATSCSVRERFAMRSSSSPRRTSSRNLGSIIWISEGVSAHFN